MQIVFLYQHAGNGQQHEYNGLKSNYWARTAHAGQLTSTVGGPAKLVLGCCACAAMHCGTAGQQMTATGGGQQMTATGGGPQEMDNRSPALLACSLAWAFLFEAHTAVTLCVYRDEGVACTCECRTCPWPVPATSRASSAKVLRMMEAGCSNTTCSIP